MSKKQAPINDSRTPDDERVLQPFLRWAGGKTKVAHRLLPFLPDDLTERIYREPFLGGGSLFLRVKPAAAILSDANNHLMQCFRFVRNSPDVVWSHLQRLTSEHRKDHYYDVREEYNCSNPSTSQAARFIYLNKASFNGIFRVNRNGEYNVPYGYKRKPLFPDFAHLKRVSGALKVATLRTQSYKQALAHAGKGDFVYLDPPYPPLNGTAFFTHYTKDRFGAEDQEELAEVVTRLDKVGCLVLMSNADVPSIRKLYKRFPIKSLEVTRFITCKTTKHAVREVVITNF